LELVGGGYCGGWATAGGADLLVDRPVRPAGAMVSQRNQGIELAAQLAQAFSHRRRLHRG
jgi:hypothetical protein